MVRCFPSIGLGPSDPLPRRDKRLHWNVDHMLDLEHADLVQVFVLRYPERIERRLGEFLEAQSVTTILAPGIGAHDVKGATHLFRVDAPAAWWDALPDELLCLCAGTT
jgi:Uri superfamily endonuclease